jgi:lincosamide nucleotidyltransferase A/C/D/E
VLKNHGLVIQQVWEAENRWLDLDGARWPTAFATNQQGAELDMHLIEVRGSDVLALCNVPWHLDRESLEGWGTIAGRPVSCVSARTQVAMHRDYELPEAHQRDVVRVLRLG